MVGVVLPAIRRVVLLLQSWMCDFMFYDCMTFLESLECTFTSMQHLVSIPHWCNLVRCDPAELMRGQAV